MSSAPIFEEQAFAEEQDISPRRGLSLRSLLATVKRQWIAVAGVTGVFGSMAYLLAAMLPPLYRGSFQVLVEPVTNEARLSEPTALTRNGGRVPGQEAFRLDYPTQIVLLQSPRILSSVVDRVRQDKPDFTGRDLQLGLTVDRLGREFRILEVVFEGRDPIVVSTVLDVLADEYLRYSLEERKSRIGEGVGFIEEQLPELRERSNMLQNDLQQLQQKHAFFDPLQEGQALSLQLRATSELRLEASRQLSEQQELYVQLQEQLGFGPDVALAASALSGDPVYQKLVLDLQSVEERIAAETARFRAGSPIVNELVAQRANLRPLLEQRARESLGDEFASDPRVRIYLDAARRGLVSQLMDVSGAIVQLELRERGLSEQEAALKAEIQAFPAIVRRYTDMQRELEVVNRTLDQLLSERERLKVEAAQTQVPWELVTEPQLPRDRDGKPIPLAVSSKKMLVLGAFFGLIAGTGLAVLIDKREDIFFSSDDLSDASPVPLLEIVPCSPVAPAIRDLKPLFGEAPDSPAAIFREAFNSIYAKLLFFYSDAPLRSIVISSPQQGDGKTTVALHLAYTAAAAGRRVLLVDANLRNPQLHTLLNLNNLQGLKQLLLQSREPQRQTLLQRLSSSDTLFVMTSGGVLSEAGQLLASGAMEKISSRLASAFDLVIYDTPPLDRYADAKFLAANAGGLVSVIGIGKTQRSVTLDVLDEISAFNLPIIGAIANDGSPRKRPKPVPRAAARDRRKVEELPSTDRHLNEASKVLPVPAPLHSGQHRHRVAAEE
ncbi:uncharacterized protein involved in exopolysaccharide biosynthesis [Rubidibacter lacunae KORDI 51-2]|uniref:non-specific protein-tyrosine kinase n=1 Tax=Rubidibacter lacunae KORDI 51-2 TaxID=582515 RepID=U5DMS1_9CHRO|nr:tyrosine-protein kinase domain-containing protein [Rubidibacter lacunae]ERN42132.1 uncharacterized protein involved in exopolysaccharide biosynthesis [Rubidibacter lacunae KORDI 51-2]